MSWHDRLPRYRSLQEVSPDRYRRVPLRLALIVPFVLLTAGAVGLVGSLSWQSGQQAIRDVVNQLQHEISKRIEQKLVAYLDTPHLINQINAEAVRRGQLKVQDQASERYLWQQIQLFDTVSWIYYGTDQNGSFIGLLRSGADRSLQIVVNDLTTNFQGHYYSTDYQGNRLQRVQGITDIYDARNRPWYQTALRVGGQASWSQIYSDFASPALIISAILPVYAVSGELMGVVGTDLGLKNISDFLNSLEISQTGEAFIIERSGLLVASSTTARSYQINTATQQSERLRAIASDDPLIRSTVQALTQTFGSLNRIQGEQQLAFKLEGKRQFIQVLPFQDQRGIDWLIVVAVPESDFMAQIYAQQRLTLLLCALTLAGTIGLGLVISRALAHPIQQLSESSRRLAEGDWQQSLPEDSPIAELQVLTHAFNEMATRLQQSFDRVKTALQDSEEKFTKVFRTCPEPVGIVTLEGRYVDVNDAFIDLFGYSKAEIIGRQATEVGHWVNLEERKRYVQLVQAGEPVRNLEFTLRDKAGKLLTVLFSADSIELQGQTYIIGLAKDISDRKQAEAALQQSEERFREIAQTISQFFFVRSAITKQFIYVSPAYERIWGRSCESLYQDPCSWAESIHPDDRSLVDESLKQQFAGNFVQREYRIIRPDGEIRWVCVQVNLVRDEAGEPLRFIGFAVDVTDRKQVSEALQRSEAKLKDVLNSTVASITSFRLFPNRQWQYKYWSEGCEAVFGYTAQEFLTDQTLWLSRVLPEDLEQGRVVNLTSLMVEQTTILEGEYRFHHKDGSLRWISYSLTSRPDSTNGWIVTTIDIDISDRKRAEAALAQSEQLFRGAFETSAFGISIRSPDGKYLQVNQALCQMLGYEESELLEMSYRQITHPDDLAIDLKNTTEKLIAGEIPYYHLEKRFIQKDGHIIWGLLSISLVRDLQQQPLYFVAQVQDITDRKRAEEALRQSEARFQKIAAASPAQIYILACQPDGSHIHFEYISSGIREIQELEPDQVLKDAMLTYNQVHPDDRALYNQVSYHSLKTLAPFSHEWRIITPSGKVKWVQANSRPERRETGEIVWYGVLLDITNRKLAEEALRRSEAALRRAQQVAHVGSWEVDVRTTRVTWSEESFHIFGWNLNQPEPNLSQFYELIHPDDRISLQQGVAQILDNGEPYKIEFRVARADGSLRYVEARGEAIVNEQGQVVQLIGTNLDVTERRQAEEAIRQSEATKNQILKAIPDLIIWMTADGTCIDFIDGGSTTNLYVKSEAVGKNLYEILPTDLAQARMNGIQQALRTGEVQIYEQQLLLKGKVRYEEVRVIGVGGDRVLVIVRDITDRKRAEAALRDSEERFRSAFRDAPIGMALISLDDRWLKVNPMLCDMLGYSEPELLPMNASSLVHPEDIEKLQRCTEQVASNENRNAQVELRYCCSQGRIAWGLISLSLVRDAQGQPLYYVAQIQDITERRAVDRMKNEFISIVSHELRTPLTAIRGFLGLLDTGIYDQKPDKVKHMIGQALTNSDRLVRLVNDILDLERLSSGKVQLVMEICEAEDVMRRAAAGVQSIADQASVTLEIIPTAVQVWAATDAIIQTLTNLLSNAIKFSPAYSIVTLSAQPQSDFVLFSVQDRGRGIPADKLETIFGRFQQVDVSDSRQKGGTGLGLAICQSIVQQHGGNIWAESMPGEGSIFYFTLPMPSGEER